MKAKLILLNQALSLIGVASIDTERNSLLVLALFVLWFGGSVMLTNWAGKKGMFKKYKKYLEEEV